jgi:hypothetical protein
VLFIPQRDRLSLHPHRSRRRSRLAPRIPPRALPVESATPRYLVLAHSQVVSAKPEGILQRAAKHTVSIADEIVRVEQSHLLEIHVGLFGSDFRSWFVFHRHPPSFYVGVAGWEGESEEWVIA